MYDKEFYTQIGDGSLRSARAIVPKVIEIFNPNSVIDFGCGTGAWLHMFYMFGVDEVLGLDGSDDGHQLIPNDSFQLIDLSDHYVPPHKYDLAISLEVAEHLPEEAADVFVKNIARCADNILWSAAVPGQRGLNHINEQWPSYWIPKFKELGFYCNGDFRFQFWNDEDIETWYRQNILLFSKNKPKWSGEVRDLIHPDNYTNYEVVEERNKF